MQLSLSSETVPSAPLDTLRVGARRRGLSGLELVVGTGAATVRRGRTGSGPGPRPLDDGTPPIQWLHLGEKISRTERLYWGRQAHLLGAGLVLGRPVEEAPLGVPAALRHGTGADDARAAVAWAQAHDASTCWEVVLSSAGRPAVEETLDVTAPTLEHVRLKGAGPEASSSDDGFSTGTVVKELALRGYTGTVALAPSGRSSEATWRRWLLEERGWGCNTAAKKAEDG